MTICPRQTDPRPPRPDRRPGLTPAWGWQHGAGGAGTRGSRGAGVADGLHFWGPSAATQGVSHTAEELRQRSGRSQALLSEATEQTVPAHRRVGTRAVLTRQVAPGSRSSLLSGVGKGKCKKVTYEE